MTRQLVPRRLLDTVVAYFRPQRVILFGSRARGEAGHDSDIDLLVVVEDDTPAEKLGQQAAAEMRRCYPQAADVFPMRASVFEKNRAITGTLAAEADADGIVVYGSPKGAPHMSTADRRARWRVVERWLAVAEVDRRTVEACLAVDSDLLPSAACHCQQAAEKLLKACLILAGKRFRKTHSLTELGVAVSANFPELADSARRAAARTGSPIGSLVTASSA